MLITMRRAVSVLKIGGHFFFRDYGRGDHAQMRFHNGHKLRRTFTSAMTEPERIGTVDEVRRLFRLVGLSTWSSWNTFVEPIRTKRRVNLGIVFGFRFVCERRSSNHYLK